MNETSVAQSAESLHCTPHRQAFTWTLRPSGQVDVEVIRRENSQITALPFGPVAEVLADVAGYTEVVQNNEFETGYGVRNGRKCLMRVRKPPYRYVLPPADWMLRPEALGTIAEATGLRKLHADRWTVLAPNAVLHPQFGPGVTVATDGLWVLLWSRPWPGADTMLVHRSNVWGPVTTTPVALAEWAGSTAGADEGTRRSSVSAALALLEQKLAEHLSASK